ncbi:hypothetical protein BC832DRAFT_540535 [Gaertneriomyces semiglobifer]|nr:hypothetical protein BC832DRAFT_540535 [Gaertneriomyces semiglobifer]
MSALEKKVFDVVVIGGSFAGLSAALQLARARRPVLIIDSGKPRNRFASHSHGFLGQDGRSPLTILSDSRAQLAKYPTCHFLENTSVLTVTKLAETPANFQVTTSSSQTFTTRRIILTTGVTDTLPTGITSIDENWGKGIFHCPYCHGYEFSDKPLGILASIDMIALHQANLLRDWSHDITLFLGGGTGSGALKPVALTEEQIQTVTRRGIKIETRPLKQVHAHGEELSGVELADGTKLPIKGLLIFPTMKFDATGLAAQIGCELFKGPMGHEILKVEPITQLSSVPGVYGAGEATGAPNIAVSVGQGSMAGVMCHQSLITEEVARLPPA